MTRPNVVAVIPAHMASLRFPGKILFPIFDVPMIEHVRRRALLSSRITDVVVATCDQVIATVINGYGGRVVITGDHHRNGTTRIAEAVADIDCSHVILLQGDEPLLLPSQIDTMADAIAANPAGDAWNGTGPLESPKDADRHSFVKCATAPDGRILYCFRRSPSYAEFAQQQEYIRKILGVIAFRKNFLEELVKLPAARTEQFESIEQMRIIEHGFTMQSVAFVESLPSVNEPAEADIVFDYIKQHPEQQTLLKLTIGVDI
jgi:3-deoxy-manno-octulosonate cytidylyltransferase (CMP-KDO synthetase)